MTRDEEDIVFLALINRANDLIAAIDGTTDQFKPEISRLENAVAKAEKVLKGGAA